MPKFLPDVKEFDNLTTKSGLSKKSWNFWKKWNFWEKFPKKIRENAKVSEKIFVKNPKF
jgi:hypothetical protein